MKTMATCSSFQDIFDKPLPENPTLIESLSTSLKQLQSQKQAEISTFTEIFGELHFREPVSYSPPQSSSPSHPLFSSPSSSMNVGLQPAGIEKFNDINIENKDDPSLFSLLGTSKTQYKNSSGNGKLKLCTEGLGSESTDDVENYKNQSVDDWKDLGKKISLYNNSSSDNLNEVDIEKASSSNNLSEASTIRNSPFSNLSGFRRTKIAERSFPPPISSIGRDGKSWTGFKSYRYNGRFVLKEIKIPNNEVLHACREDGRLTLHFANPGEEKLKEDEGEELEEQELGEQEGEEESENDDADEQNEDEEGEQGKE